MKFIAPIFLALAATPAFAAPVEGDTPTNLAHLETRAAKCNWWKGLICTGVVGETTACFASLPVTAKVVTALAVVQGLACVSAARQISENCKPCVEQSLKRMSSSYKLEKCINKLVPAITYANAKKICTSNGSPR
ncbi:uncharacterized protein EV422DRAFT_335176 [Fimicolochytrium jonesii]|uniref:uncharacterized protein n=1 Tax=Fimicolochytrium jonesii TaxID=1396493 RepID=UPI0022FF2D86|nr:uncharacterized protein EV422DRAFT_335176 [Fimicolochytrium jonesii]KAI8816026.1 hypothetical protein EV422DRAFT_335176 [Fimicolochytrium jonesii]